MPHAIMITVIACIGFHVAAPGVDAAEGTRGPHVEALGLKMLPELLNALEALGTAAAVAAGNV